MKKLSVLVAVMVFFSVLASAQFGFDPNQGPNGGGGFGQGDPFGGPPQGYERQVPFGAQPDDGFSQGGYGPPQGGFGNQGYGSQQAFGFADSFDPTASDIGGGESLVGVKMMVALLRAINSNKADFKEACLAGNEAALIDRIKSAYESNKDSVREICERYEQRAANFSKDLCSSSDLQAFPAPPFIKAAALEARIELNFNTTSQDMEKVCLLVAGKEKDKQIGYAQKRWEENAGNFLEQCVQRKKMDKQREQWEEQQRTQREQMQNQQWGPPQGGYQNYGPGPQGPYNGPPGGEYHPPGQGPPPQGQQPFCGDGMCNEDPSTCVNDCGGAPPSDGGSGSEGGGAQTQGNIFGPGNPYVINLQDPFGGSGGYDPAGQQGYGPQGGQQGSGPYGPDFGQGPQGGYGQGGPPYGSDQFGGGQGYGPGFGPQNYPNGPQQYGPSGQGGFPGGDQGFGPQGGGFGSQGGFGQGGPGMGGPGFNMGPFGEEDCELSKEALVEKVKEFDSGMMPGNEQFSSMCKSVALDVSERLFEFKERREVGKELCELQLERKKAALDDTASACREALDEDKAIVVITKAVSNKCQLIKLKEEQRAQVSQSVEAALGLLDLGEELGRSDFEATALSIQDESNKYEESKQQNVDFVKYILGSPVHAVKVKEIEEALGKRKQELEDSKETMSGNAAEALGEEIQKLDEDIEKKKKEAASHESGIFGRIGSILSGSG